MEEYKFVGYSIVSASSDKESIGWCHNSISFQLSNEYEVKQAFRQRASGMWRTEVAPLVSHHDGQKLGDFKRAPENRLHEKWTRRILLHDREGVQLGSIIAPASRDGAINLRA